MRCARGDVRVKVGGGLHFRDASAIASRPVGFFMRQPAKVTHERIPPFDLPGIPITGAGGAEKNLVIDAGESCPLREVSGKSSR
jgi:hypothetical protein